MVDIAEVQIINSAGIPVYYHNNEALGSTNFDNAYLLQASFITALSHFANELHNGEVKVIQFERKDYLMAKGSQFAVIFTSVNKEMNLAEIYDGQIQDVRNYLDDKLLQLNLDLMSPGSVGVENMLDEFDVYLRASDLVEGDDQDLSLKQNLNSLIFKSVGYEPGKCNIGRAERMKRLSFGLTFFSISALLLAVITILGLPSYLVFVLVIPNFLGFLGLLQYFYEFCTTNALNHSYSMV